MFMSQAVRKKCAVVRGSYLRLSFCMHAVIVRYFSSFLLSRPKLTLLHPDLHKHTVGDLCQLACGCQL